MTLIEYAKLFNISRHTAYNRYKMGLIPGAFIMMGSNEIWIPDDIMDRVRSRYAVLYSRSLTVDEKKALMKEAKTKGFEVEAVIDETESIWSHDQKLYKVLKSGKTIIVRDFKEIHPIVPHLIIASTGAGYFYIANPEEQPSKLDALEAIITDLTGTHTEIRKDILEYIYTSLQLI